MRGLVGAIKAFQDSVDRFDAAAAARLGVNETDLRCLTLLSDRGRCSPSALADLLGLTRGATTTALIRLEAAGLVTRALNAEDHRSHFVQLSAHARARLDEVWTPVVARGREHLERYSDAQLRLVATFMARSVDLQEACRSDLLDGGGAHRP